VAFLREMLSEKPAPGWRKSHFPPAASDTNLALQELRHARCGGALVRILQTDRALPWQETRL
jgi:hypothetical protein